MGVFPNTPITEISDLEKANLYGYILPNNEILSRGWIIEMSPFQLNCSLLGEGIFYPLFINYKTDQGNTILQTRISDGDAWIPPVAPEGVVTMELKYLENGRVEYYKRSDSGTQIYFQDMFGLDVVLESPTLSVNEMIELASILEYVGAAPEDIINPWQDGCS